MNSKRKQKIKHFKCNELGSYKEVMLQGIFKKSRTSTALIKKNNRLSKFKDLSNYRKYLKTQGKGLLYIGEDIENGVMIHREIDIAGAMIND